MIEMDEGAIYIYLVNKKAFSKDSAVFMEKTDALNALMKRKRVAKYRNRFHLTDIGQLCAYGECSLRFKEKEKSV